MYTVGGGGADWDARRKSLHGFERVHGFGGGDNCDEADVRGSLKWMRMDGWIVQM